MILDGIVRPTGQQAGNGGPPVSVAGVGGDDGVILGWREGAVLDAGAELVAPPEPARFPRPPLYITANQGPIPRAVTLDESGQDPILFGTPWALDFIWAAGRSPRPWLAGERGIGGGRFGGGRGR